MVFDFSIYNFCSNSSNRYSHNPSKALMSNHEQYSYAWVNTPAQLINDNKPVSVEAAEWNTVKPRQQAVFLI